jgi:hypothetical protein
MLQTEFAFTLPCGFIDGAGNLARAGVMRRAIAFDEIEPLGDSRVQQNEALLIVFVLSRVVTRLGPLSPVGPEVIGSLFTLDFVFLQDLYATINAGGDSIIATSCPRCGSALMLDLAYSEERGAA